MSDDVASGKDRARRVALFVLRTCLRPFYSGFNRVITPGLPRDLGLTATDLGRAGGVVFLALMCATPPLQAQKIDVRHGRELTATIVGPRASGYAAGHLHVGQERSAQVVTGQTIRDDTVAPFIRHVTTGETYDGFSVPGPHLLIEGYVFEGPLDIYATLPLVLRGVTVRLAGAHYWGILSRVGAGPLYVLWSKVEGVDGRSISSKIASPGVQRGLYLESPNSIVYRSHITRTSDGIQVHAAGTRVIETLIDDLTTWEGEHNDGIQMIGKGERLTVQRSRIVNPNSQTSCLLLQRDGHVIEDNYLSGGGWVIYGGATAKPPDIKPSHGIRITGTIFGQERSAKSGTFGPVADWDGSFNAGNVWRDNRFADGRPVEPVKR